MNFGIITNMRRPDAEKVVARILDWAGKHGVSLFFDEEMKDKIECDCPIMPRHQLPDHADVIVSLGGDGTLLAAARAVGSNGTPILGINLGALGFLTQLKPAVLEGTLTDILNNRYKIEKRMVAEVEIENGQRLQYPYALNDVVVDRGSVSRIISLDLYADDYFICSYAADGLIISTPTGSTAYSLAVGGPIVTPTMNALIVSPISAFSLTTRPIIFSGDDELRIVTRSKHSEPVLTVDGQVDCRLSRESSFIVRRADYSINFIILRKNMFYDVLRSKLHWGRLPESEPGRSTVY